MSKVDCTPFRALQIQLFSCRRSTASSATVFAFWAHFPSLRNIRLPAGSEHIEAYANLLASYRSQLRRTWVSFFSSDLIRLVIISCPNVLINAWTQDCCTSAAYGSRVDNSTIVSDQDPKAFFRALSRCPSLRTLSFRLKRCWGVDRCGLKDISFRELTRMRTEMKLPQPCELRSLIM